MKRALWIFGIAFILNVVWENLHSVLYVSYKSGSITEFILLRASLFDAFVITLLAVPFLWSKVLQNKQWLIIVLGIAVAICNEWYGLSPARWVYDVSMPIIPFLNVGITPALQLGLLGYLSLVLSVNTTKTVAYRSWPPLGVYFL